MNKTDIIPSEIISSKIYLIRGKKVMFDKDLAIMYNVDTKRLKEQVKRNLDRFPSDFMFELTSDEFQNLRSQNATSSSHGGTRYLPMAFTEHGVLMLSSVLNSKLAISVNIQIMRIFTKLKEAILENKDILIKIEKMEKKLLKQDESNERMEKELQIVFNALKKLLNSPQPERNKIGYKK
jgi:hypothetical protein